MGTFFIFYSELAAHFATAVRPQLPAMSSYVSFANEP